MSGPARTNKTRRRLSPWFRYADARSWERLAPNADVIASVSVFGANPDAAFFERCRQAGIGTLKLVGGQAAAFDTAAHARETIEGYLRDCAEGGYDGINLDFEHIDAAFRDAYSSFMRDLAGELHARGKQLSICVGGHSLYLYPRPPEWLFYDPQVVGEVCDEVRVMCYDMFVAHRIWHGPTSTGPWARDSMLFWLRHVPREKLLMGLPAYSNEFDLTPGSGNGRQQPFDSPAGLPGAGQLERIWSDYEKIHIYRYLDADGHVHLFFASDAESTRAHLDTVEELDIPGVAFWHYDTMSPGISPGDEAAPGPPPVGAEEARGIARAGRFLAAGRI